MKIVILIILLMVPIILVSQRKDSIEVDSLRNEVNKQSLNYDSIRSISKEISLKQDAVIKNLESQNSTIQTVSTIFAIIIAVLIFYAGWNAVSIEKEYTKITEEKNKIIEEKNKIFKEFLDIRKDLGDRLISVKENEKEIIEIKEK